jgi:hypothetical protein|tara:strand:+ start:4506 stop:4763 length:258 start_codon:yes stop_codon:yes gene_type:complete
MLNEKLDFRFFIVSFAIGMGIVYFYQPKMEIIYKFPNPNNLETVYTDKNDGCYKFKIEKKDCDTLDPSQIKEHPVLEDFRSKVKK